HQIKAVQNSGAFDPSNPSILHAAEPTGNATSIKNATVAEERAKRDFPPEIAALARTWRGTVWPEALERIAEDPQAGRRLVAELMENPRAVTDVEDALLAHQQVTLQNLH